MGGLAIGRSVGVSRRTRGHVQTLADFFDKLIIDATAISASNGDPLSTISDTSGNGNDFTQAGAIRPTYVSSSATLLAPAIATNGTSQYAVCAGPVLGGGLSAFSFCVAMTFTSTTSFRSAICFGTNSTNGFDLNINRNSDGNWDINVATVGHVTDGAPDTNPHLFFVQYSSGTWSLEIDGVAKSLTNASAATPVAPTTRAVLGACNTVPNFLTAGHYGAICAASRALTPTERATVRTILKAKFPGLP